MKFEKECPFCGYKGIKLNGSDRARCMRCEATAPTSIWDDRVNSNSVYLQDYINENFNGNGTAFAKSLGITRQQVQYYLDKNYIVVGGSLYSWRRYLHTQKRVK